MRTNQSIYLDQELNAQSFVVKTNMPVSSRDAECCLCNPRGQTSRWIWWLQRSVGLHVWAGDGAAGQRRAQPFSSQLPAPRWVCRTKPRCHSCHLTACWQFLLFVLLPCDKGFIQGSTNNERRQQKSPK